MRTSALASMSVVAVLVSPIPLLASCSQERESGMTRDEIYRSALETMKTIEQEGPAVAGSVEELRAALTELRARAAEGVSTPKSRTAPPPQGPFPPSRQPSPENEQEKRRRATEDRFLTGGPLEKETESRTLQGVSEDWIASSSERALAELSRLDELLKKSPTDEKAIDESLGKLGSAIRGMAKPPPPK